MNIQDIKTFIRVYNKLEDVSTKIFQYIKDNYLDQLRFGRYSRYQEFFIIANRLYISYYNPANELGECSYLPSIPIELLETESSWQQFLDSDFEKRRQKDKERKALEKENKERELYEKLKKKYEV